jgi:anhydro-N-acetylmuramic acid kinase
VSAVGCFIGLMSGTSLDGVDGVLTRSDDTLRVLAHASAPFDAPLRAELQALNTPGPNELHRAALAANALVDIYAQVVQTLLRQSGLTARDVRAIGAHGQTVRHQPGLHDGIGYTLQLNQPALLAERCGIDVVADFRSRDVAAGGQGAPLVPAFHQRVFGRPGQHIAVLNIGGIANLSVLGPEGNVLGFDCGPGNLLMDHWCQLHTGHAFDRDGQWAAQGRVQEDLLAQLMAEPFVRQPPPKSTGRDLFNPAWLMQRLQMHADLRPQDVQATLAAFTAQAEQPA